MQKLGPCLLAVVGWPLVLDLNVGQTAVVERGTGEGTVRRRIEVVAVREWHEPVYGLQARDHRIVAGAEARLRVDGVEGVVTGRPFQMPVAVNGLRIALETTRDWAREAAVAAMTDMVHDVRLSVCLSGETWGSPDLRFPIGAYRWHASSYHNTWGALVPQPDVVYYHRGEDFGAIPDRLPVLAGLDGRVDIAPADQRQRSNTLGLEVAPGLSLRHAHMNTASFMGDFPVGALLTRGQPFAKTGAHWAGKPSQRSDPHLHYGWSLRRDDGTAMAINPYPGLVEAYFRDYPDSLLPIAGGYRFAHTGEVLRLDGTRSLARPGRAIAGHAWHLSDGRVVTGAVAEMVYARPGFYAEELRVRADDGVEDRAYAQVRVFAAERPAGPAFCGFLHSTPVRGVTPGRPVEFWNRLWIGAAAARIEYGDGTPPAAIGASARHVYAAPGLYTVTLHTEHAGQPVAVKTRVWVE